jgi:hypothetical protein
MGHSTLLPLDREVVAAARLAMREPLELPPLEVAALKAATLAAHQ